MRASGTPVTPCDAAFWADVPPPSAGATDFSCLDASGGVSFDALAGPCLVTAYTTVHLSTRVSYAGSGNETSATLPTFGLAVAVPTNSQLRWRVGFVDCRLETPTAETRDGAFTCAAGPADVTSMWSRHRTTGELRLRCYGLDARL